MALAEELLARIPPVPFAALRATRTGMLWIAGIPEVLLRRLQGRVGSRPPLWLRRHTGWLSKYDSSGSEMAALIQTDRLLRANDSVLDVGCGTGVMVSELGALIGAGGRYIGFDVHRPSLQWCVRQFAADPRCEFHLAPSDSPYADVRKSGQASVYRFPASSGEVDFILAKSLFTHLLERQARQYLIETARCLRPGRIALLTCFLFEPGSRTSAGQTHFFRFGDAGGRIRWRWKGRPEAAVAYEKELFLSMAGDAGLRLCNLIPGFLNHEVTPPIGQDILYFTKD